ncbi:zinc-ribbon domain-containing protein [Gordonia sp. CPCC 205515]|uniref:zinc-ribbon domain-containing protein n=1 Tax=Gordonia sp. CPCC 205515 TaxID=3140791 RepID=UPI003AF34D54
MATWRCDQGHEFDVQFRVMAQHERHHCTCARHKRVHRGVNDLASRNPILARQWDTDRNGKGPHTVTVFSSRPVWWTCPAGHHFRTSPVARRFLPPGANGCQQCWLSSPIDPDLHRHRVAPELCPTPDELDRYFETPPDRSLRPTTSQKRTTAETSGRRRAYTRYSEETKAAAINLYADLRDSHRSRQATDRAVAAQLGIRDLGNIKKWHRERGVDRW